MDIEIEWLKSIYWRAKSIFEKRKFSGFKNYDFYLSKLYGDYMKLPPEDKRRTHSVNAVWK